MNNKEKELNSFSVHCFTAQKSAKKQCRPQSLHCPDSIFCYIYFLNFAPIFAPPALLVAKMFSP